MIKGTGNLAIQKFRSLANWVFYSSVYNFMGGTIRQTAALGFLGSKAPKRVKRRVEICMTGEQRTSMFRSLAVESKQLHGVTGMAAVNYVARYYMQREARYLSSESS